MNNELTNIQFRELNVNDYFMILNHTESFIQPLIVTELINYLFCWDKNPKITFINGNILLQAEEQEPNQLYFILLGINDLSSSIQKIFTYQKNNEFQQIIEYIPEEMVPLCSKDNRLQIIREDYCSYSYLLTSFLSGFSGMRTHRHRFNRFKRENIKAQYQIHNLSDKKAFAKAIKVFHEWQIGKNKPDDEVSSEFLALNNMNKIAHLFDFKLCLLQVLDKIIDFCVVEFTPKNYVVSHFHKTLLGYQGAKEFSYFSLAQAAQQAGFQFLNLGEDMGNSGLTHFKKSFHPTLCISSYKIIPNKNNFEVG